MELDTNVKKETIKVLWKWYIYYSCVAEDTIKNVKLSLGQMEGIAILKEDIELLKQIKQSQFDIAMEELINNRIKS